MYIFQFIMSVLILMGVGFKSWEDLEPAELIARIISLVYVFTILYTSFNHIF